MSETVETYTTYERPDCEGAAAMAEASSDGPWHWMDAFSVVNTDESASVRLATEDGRSVLWPTPRDVIGRKADLAFIAACRSGSRSVPALVEHIERCEAVMRRCLDVLPNGRPCQCPTCNEIRALLPARPVEESE